MGRVRTAPVEMVEAAGATMTPGAAAVSEMVNGFGEPDEAVMAAVVVWVRCLLGRIILEPRLDIGTDSVDSG